MEEVDLPPEMETHIDANLMSSFKLGAPMSDTGHLGGPNIRTNHYADEIISGSTKISMKGRPSISTNGGGPDDEVNPMD